MAQGLNTQTKMSNSEHIVHALEEKNKFADMYDQAPTSPSPLFSPAYFFWQFHIHKVYESRQKIFSVSPVILLYKYELCWQLYISPPSQNETLVITFYRDV